MSVKHRPIVRSFKPKYVKEAAAHVRAGGHAVIWEQEKRALLVFPKPAGDNPDDFNTSTVWWYVRNTGIPISFGTTVVIGFMVGVAISCQTFYSFVLDNLKHLGALKAMGMSNLRLSIMLLIQALTVGLIGFGLGLLATAAFASGSLANGQPPFYMPWQIPVATFLVIQVICMLAALLGIIRLSLYEPAMVFRA